MRLPKGDQGPPTEEKVGHVMCLAGVGSELARANDIVLKHGQCVGQEVVQKRYIDAYDDFQRVRANVKTYPGYFIGELRFVRGQI